MGRDGVGCGPDRDDSARHCAQDHRQPGISAHGFLQPRRGPAESFQQRFRARDALRRSMSRKIGLKAKFVGLFTLSLLLGLTILTNPYAQTSWQGEWDKTVAAAKKEGKVVVGIPPSTELR